MSAQAFILALFCMTSSQSCVCSTEILKTSLLLLTTLLFLNFCQFYIILFRQTFCRLLLNEKEERVYFSMQNIYFLKGLFGIRVESPKGLEA